MDRIPIPILLYHAVSDDPPEWLAPWSLPPDDFAAQLDAILSLGCTPLTVSELVDARDAGTALPDQPVLVTFDDGYMDTVKEAAPAMAHRGIASTVYVTTGALAGRPTAVGLKIGPATMLEWQQLGELEAMGIEVGAHAHTHAQLDTLGRDHVRWEVQLPKQLLEDHLGHRVRSFAYPHGYSSPSVRRTVADAGYDSACGVRNALSSPTDDRFSLARLTVMRTTPLSELASWVTGKGAAIAPDHEWRRTQAWRIARRMRAVVTRSAGNEDEPGDAGDDHATSASRVPPASDGAVPTTPSAAPAPSSADPINPVSTGGE
jgi:peptidoglycan/xylan/chitin deacetylase (PgdA/CDA1 family)